MIDQLSTEIIIEIMNYLEYPDNQQLKKVNKRIYEIYNNNENYIFKQYYNESIYDIKELYLYMLNKDKYLDITKIIWFKGSHNIAVVKEISDEEVLYYSLPTFVMRHIKINKIKIKIKNNHINIDLKIENTTLDKMINQLNDLYYIFGNIRETLKVYYDDEDDDILYRIDYNHIKNKKFPNYTRMQYMLVKAIKLFLT